MKGGGFERGGKRERLKEGEVKRWWERERERDGVCVCERERDKGIERE